MEAGASYEEAIKKGSKKGKTGFADLVWKPRVLIEMKKRGEDLSKHYSQAFDYWTRLVPNRPKYVILCNFDEFWIYDFNTQLNTPIDIVELQKLPDRVGAFGFMELGNRKPVFNNNQVEITEGAARRMGEIATEFAQKLFSNNEYTDYLYFHGIAVQMAEALAEWTHARIRRKLGFAAEDPDNIRDMLAQRYRGSRYSFGYPACPNIQDQYKQLDLLKTDRINLFMDESEQIYPEQSTTAIITKLN